VQQLVEATILLIVLYTQSRYYAMCTFTLQIFANFSLAFDASMCRHYLPFQAFGEGTPLAIVTDLVIGLRVYALYGRNKYIAVVLAALLLVQTVVIFLIYLTPSMHAMTLPDHASTDQIPLLHFCLVETSSRLSNFQSAGIQWMQAIYDATAFGLIACKTAKSAFKERAVGGVRALIMKNGLLYFAVVFSAYLTWAMMTIFSPSGIKYAAAIPSVILSCLAVNRLTLSLRAFNGTDEVDACDAGNCPSNIVFERPRMRRRRSWIGTSTFEVPGDSHVERTSEQSHELESFDSETCRRTDRPESGSEVVSTRLIDVQKLV